MDDQASMEGKVYYNVDDDSLSILNFFEDDIYQQTYIDVFVEESTEKLSVQAYVIPITHAAVLSHELWSEEVFRANHLTDYVQMCMRCRTTYLNK